MKLFLLDAIIIQARRVVLHLDQEVDGSRGGDTTTKISKASTHIASEINLTTLRLLFCA
jgi:hypothetical protein